MHGDRNSGAVRLLANETLNVHDPLGTVDLDNLALRALRRATDDTDLVILADGERADLALVSAKKTRSASCKHRQGLVQKWQRWHERFLFMYVHRAHRGAPWSEETT